MKIVVVTLVRNERDERIISNLRRKLHDYAADLIKVEKDLVKARAKLVKDTEEQTRPDRQLKQRYDREKS